MFWIKAIVACVTVLLVLMIGSVFQRHLSSLPSAKYGLWLPAISFVIACALSISPFMVTFSMNFSILSFIAALSVFVLYVFPSVFFFLIYVESRSHKRRFKKEREKMLRHTRKEVTRKKLEPPAEESMPTPRPKRPVPTGRRTKI